MKYCIVRVNWKSINQITKLFPPRFLDLNTSKDSMSDNQQKNRSKEGSLTEADKYQI